MGNLLCDNQVLQSVSFEVRGAGVKAQPALAKPKPALRATAKVGS